MSLVKEVDSTSLYLVYRLKHIHEDYWVLMSDNEVESKEAGEALVKLNEKNHPQYEYKIMEVGIRRKIL